jgi:transcriptional regulator with XRE-family HTH domain
MIQPYLLASRAAVGACPSESRLAVANMSKAASYGGAHPAPLGESRREALGRFLRERRESLDPTQVGISSHRGRRTPGLRREEVAFLADIGVKWYARLEAGDDVHPSAATLTGIAMALHLSNAELEYLLGLAGRQPPLPSSEAMTVPEPLRALTSAIRGVAITMGDRILTPMLWNDVAEALYDHSRFDDAVERNGLVRSLLDPEFIEFLGPEREQLVFHAVGMFRLNYSSPSPSPIAAAVYERVKNEPLFQQAWQQRVVANELTGKSVTIRKHATVGKLAMFAVDLTSGMQSGFLLRAMMPADAETAMKFRRLEELGRSRQNAASLHL